MPPKVARLLQKVPSNVEVDFFLGPLLLANIGGGNGDNYRTKIATTLKGAGHTRTQCKYRCHTNPFHQLGQIIKLILSRFVGYY